MRRWGPDVARPVKPPPFLSRIVLAILVAALIAALISDPIIVVIVNVIGAVALLGGIICLCAAAFLIVAYFMLSGRWPWG